MQSSNMSLQIAFVFYCFSCDDWCHFLVLDALIETQKAPDSNYSRLRNNVRSAVRWCCKYSMSMDLTDTLKNTHTTENSLVSDDREQSLVPLKKRKAGKKSLIWIQEDKRCRHWLKETFTEKVVGELSHVEPSFSQKDACHLCSLVTVHTVLMISNLSGYEPESKECANTHTHILRQPNLPLPGKYLKEVGKRKARKPRNK